MVLCRKFTRVCGIALLASLLAVAAAAGSERDIAYLSEHVPESGMDAAYMSLPWPGGRFQPREWQRSVDVAVARTETDFIRLAGPVVSFALGRGLNARWGYEMLGFYSDMQISGGGGQTLLAPPFLTGVPLELPQPAGFTVPRGSVRQYGVGACRSLRTLS